MTCAAPVIVYLQEKRAFLRDTEDSEIEEVIHRRYREITGRSVGKSELQSWKTSLGSVANILRDSSIPDSAGVGIEFVLPQSSKRIDVTVSGYSHDGSRSAVIVELKQWETAEASPRDGIVVTTIGAGKREVVHPSYQAWSYAAFLESFNEAVYKGGIRLHPCAYLHNYVPDDVIQSAHYKTYLDRAPVFLKGDKHRAALRKFIAHRVPKGDCGDVLRALNDSPIRPSKALADSVAKLLSGKPEFVLLDDQKEVYEAALAAGNRARGGSRSVLIVEGGPGTGKSVVAINILAAALKQGLNAKYVSKNAAPRDVYSARLAGAANNPTVANLFAGSGSFMTTAADAFDLLIVDEAHRLTEKSGFYGNEGDHQVKELIRAATCSVFFIDEAQRVTLKDVGSAATIEGFASDRGASVEHYSLRSQFRCGGSDGYLSWLDHVLGIRETANESLVGIPYDFKVFNSPSALHQAIVDRNGRNKARVVAGYCWDWRSKSDPAAFDVVIGDYRRRWNLSEYGNQWIEHPNSVQEVGCIHTCQGLEVDYIGVIVGPDVAMRESTLVTRPDGRARHDKTVKGLKKMMKSDPDRAAREADCIIRNTYRTLMTRGMKGCYVFATDPAVREYLSAHSGLAAVGGGWA